MKNLSSGGANENKHLYILILPKWTNPPLSRHTTKHLQGLQSSLLNMYWQWHLPILYHKYKTNLFYQTNSEKTKDWKKLYKRPMGHIAFLRKQFKSIYTYDYIITFIKRIKKTINNFMRMYWFFIWTNLNPLDPRMLCAKFGWNWPSGSGEEDFLISSMYFCYFKIISPWKRVGPFIWTLNPLRPMMLCAKFGWNWHSGSGEGDF